MELFNNMKYFLRLNVLLTVLLSCFALQAQKITVKAQLDSTVLWIGDQSNLSFEISQSPDQVVNTPLFFDTIPGGLEVVGGIRLDTIKSKDGYLLVKQNYTITAFEDSLYYLPSLPFVTGDDTVWSNPLSLKVVQPFQIDTASNTIADIKPIYKPNFDWKWFFKLVLFVLLIIAVVILAYFLIRKFVLKKPILPTAIEVKENLPPHEIALKALDKIKNEKSWQQGRIKEYHTELTDVLREYVERLFNVSSMEMTSEEILDSLNMLKVSQKSAHNGLKQILQLADLVKFAKWNPSPEENELSLLNAYLFVNQTKIEETKPAVEEQNQEEAEEKQQ